MNALVAWLAARVRKFDVVQDARLAAYLDADQTRPEIPSTNVRIVEPVRVPRPDCPRCDGSEWVPFSYSRSTIVPCPACNGPDKEGAGVGADAV
jgi:hypothetical protein